MHIFDEYFITIGMKVLRKIKFGAEDLWQTLCVHKWKTTVCALVAIVGVAVGGVFVKTFAYSWWYNNRCEYAYKLFEGNFGLLFSFLLWTAVFYGCLLACQLIPSIKYVSLVALAAACFYCGANTAAAIMCWSVWGILFALLVTSIEVVGYFLSCLLCCCQPAACRSVREAFCDTKPALLILIGAFAAKFIAFFIILRLLTAVI